MSNKPKRNKLTFKEYFINLDLSRKILAILTSVLLLLYPGQNYYQTLIIHPGNVYSYSLPKKVLKIYPVSDGVQAPIVTASSVVIQDLSSKNMLFEKNADLELLPASTTKIMTALVALDYYDLSDQITIKNEDRAVGSTMELQLGEVITVENLLYGLLIESGNDAALALADNYCSKDGEGKLEKCGYDAFISAMNKKASDLHLSHTVYKNVSGVETYGHVTSARDLAILATQALNNPIIEKIVQIKDIIVTDVSGSITHNLVSTNQLLGIVSGVKGLKTGWTERAGECLVSYVERDGHRVVVVVLHSLDRFGESAKLIDWVYSHHSWQPFEI